MDKPEDKKDERPAKVPYPPVEFSKRSGMSAEDFLNFSRIFYRPTNPE